MIELTHIHKRFHAADREVRALDDVNLTIDDGEIVGIVGTSGAGKSTLLRLVNLLEPPDEGEVLIDGRGVTGLRGKRLAAHRRGIGMVFQQFNLLSSSSVFDNVAMPLKLAGVPADEIRTRVTELLGFVELSDKANARPGQLSGGQKQRVGIARALANRPGILLADEATSALDPDTTDSILELLARVNRELGVTILIVTHEMHVIAKVCHKVAVMSRGRIVESGPVLDVFANPEQDITRRFVRTIVDDRVPRRLMEQVRETPEPYALWRLAARGDVNGSEALAQVHRQFGVTTRLLSATIQEIGDDLLGVLNVQALGAALPLRQARQHLFEAGYDITDLDLHTLEIAAQEGTAA